MKSLSLEIGGCRFCHPTFCQQSSQTADPQMHVFVKSLTDKAITPEVKASVTMKKVKVKIKDMGHPASPRVWLLQTDSWGGQALSDYNIQKESTLPLVGWHHQTFPLPAFPRSTTVRKQSPQALCTHAVTCHRKQGQTNNLCPKKAKYSLFTGLSLPHKAAPYLGPGDLEPQWNWEEITAVKMDKELKEEM